ncbi:Stc1 domain-containing protein [Tricharina praecox]|uniref:Stc1 domain-containing protein n=1 Tax=Tricharina praecox TaxID=43433 RepID=UPI00222011A4|nr:Stc1 domain-containing protein [Tricharina praecox]KAI5855997.1 Stc1 domain-containing protein [Tricharina praecox]
MPPSYLPPVGRNLVNQRQKGVNVGNSGGGVPNEITCYVCKKKKPKSQYANRQIQRFADTICNVYAPAGRTLTDPKTTCKTCTPQQVTELTCCNCEKTKGLTHFAKNQRKNPDAARCMKCVQRGLGAGSGDEFSDGDDDTDQDDSERELSDFDGAKPTEKKPLVRRSAAANAGMFNDENSAVTSFGDTSSMVSADPAADEGWQPVTAAGNYPQKREYALPEYTHPSYTPGPLARAPTQQPAGAMVRTSGQQPAGTVVRTQGQQPAATRGGWNRVPKTVAVQESDEWDNYARDLTNRRDANKRNSARKNKKPATISDAEDEDWD